MATGSNFNREADMTVLQEQYVADREGNRVGVLLGLEQFEQRLEPLEELDDIRAYDEAKASEEEFIPFELAVADIQQKRQCK